MRPILVEATTRAEARQGWLYTYANQYAEMECLSAKSLQSTPAP
jgi:hypothetical protein